MMKTIKELFLLSLFSLSSIVYAQDQTSTRPVRKASYANYGAAYRNELGASATVGEISSANSTTAIEIGASYKNLVTQDEAFGFILNVDSNNGRSNNHTYFGIWGTYTYFFGTHWNTNNSFFTELGIGLADTGLSNQGKNDVTKSARQFSWLAMVGKNFPIYDKIHFTPKAGVQKIGSEDTNVVLIPLNLTIAF